LIGVIPAFIFEHLPALVDGKENDMNREETPIQLDLSVETLALLSREDEASGPLADGAGTQASPPTCCP
jgi:hypothetical protein